MNKVAMSNFRGTLGAAVMIGGSMIAASAMADQAQGSRGNGYNMGPGMMGGYGRGSDLNLSAEQRSKIGKIQDATVATLRLLRHKSAFDRERPSLNPHRLWIDADVGRFDHLTDAADFILDDAAEVLRGVRRALKR